MKKILTFLSILTLTPTLPTTIISCDDNSNSNRPLQPPTLTLSDIETIFADTSASMDGSDLVLNSESLNFHDFHISSEDTTLLTGSIMYNQSQDNPLGLYNNQMINQIRFAKSFDQFEPFANYEISEKEIVVKNYPENEKKILSGEYPNSINAPFFYPESISYIISSDDTIEHTVEPIKISIKDSDEPSHFYDLFLELTSSRIVDETRKFVYDNTFLRKACANIFEMMDGFTNLKQLPDSSGCTI